MSFGIALYSETGSPFLSMGDTTFSFVDLITVQPSSASSKSYPDFIGWVIRTSVVQDTPNPGVADVVNFSSIRTTISYPGGVPTVAWDYLASIGAPQGASILVLGN